MGEEKRHVGQTGKLVALGYMGEVLLHAKVETIITATLKRTLITCLPNAHGPMFRMASACASKVQSSIQCSKTSPRYQPMLTCKERLAQHPTVARDLHAMGTFGI